MAHGKNDPDSLTSISLQLTSIVPWGRVIPSPRSPLGGSPDHIITQIENRATVDGEGRWVIGPEGVLGELEICGKEYDYLREGGR
jgi:hypothetical protein